MSVRVDDLSSDVVPEGEPAQSGEGGGTGAWELEDRYRDLADRLIRDAERTRAEAYDD